MTPIRLEGLPMPPSSNNQYAIIRRGGKSLHVPSRELVKFRKAMQDYAKKERESFWTARQKILDLLAQRKWLTVDAIFYFDEKKLFLKKNNQPRKFDVSNRLKALHDELSKCLGGIDDSYFFQVIARKQIGREGVDVEIRAYE